MYTFQLTQESLLIALFIFSIRVISTSLDTLRLIFTLRSNKIWVWLLGFINSLIWLLTIAIVLSDTKNLLNVVVYAAGFGWFCDWKCHRDVVGKQIGYRFC